MPRRHSDTQAAEARASRRQEFSNGDPPVRLLNLTDLSAKLAGLSCTATWALRRRPDFPRPVDVGRAPRYIASEIDEWLLARPRVDTAA